MSAAAAIEQLGGIADQKTKIERYKALLVEYLSKMLVPKLKVRASLGAHAHAPRCECSLLCVQALIEHLLHEEVPLVLSRQVLQDLANALHSLPPEQLKEIGAFTLELMAPRATSFEEQVSIIRECLSGVYEQEESWSLAAKMLAGGRLTPRPTAPLPTPTPPPARRHPARLWHPRARRQLQGGQVHQDRDALPAGRRVGQR